jgi:hypothetical protein
MCLNKFDSEINLNHHKTYCGAHNPTRIEMPEPYDYIIRFQSYNHSMEFSFVIYVYSDFECMIKKFKYVNLVIRRLIPTHIRNMFLTTLSIISSVLMATISHLLNIQERTLLKCSIKN